MNKSLVFVSHATADKQYAVLLGHYIERTFENTKVFVASAPEAIPSGRVWFEEILRNLTRADALVIVYSRNAQSRLWVGFELGYIWKKYDGKNIHCVYDPEIDLQSPLNELQAKDFSDIPSMAVFFRGLSKDLSRRYDDDPTGITAIVDNVPKYDEFAKWKTLLESGQWSKAELSGGHNHKTVWTSVDDPSYQIQYSGEYVKENFSEPWSAGFPDRHTSSSLVDLNVSGSTVRQETFVSLDGGRYFVPLPEVRVDGNSGKKSEDRRTFHYDKTSLRYLLGKVIGDFYIMHGGLDEFAIEQGIDVN